MLMAGKPLIPIPKLISTYGRVGRLTASTSRVLWATSPAAWVSNMKRRYSSQVTSCACIQKASILTLCCGCSSFCLWGSEGGDPISNSPSGTGTMSNETVVPGMTVVAAGRPFARTLARGPGCARKCAVRWRAPRPLRRRPWRFARRAPDAVRSAASAAAQVRAMPLDQLGDARLGQGRKRQAAVPFEVIGEQLLLRVQAWSQVTCWPV